MVGSCECGNEPSNAGYGPQLFDLQLNVFQYHTANISRKMQANKQLLGRVSTTLRLIVSRGFICNNEHYEDIRGRGKVTVFVSFEMFAQ